MSDMRNSQKVEELATETSLTRRQAEAWLFRKFYRQTRESTAEALEIAPNTVDEHVRRAKDKIEIARQTVAIVDEIEEEIEIFRG